MTRCPFFRLRLSTTERVPSSSSTTQLSMRLSSARVHLPLILKYSGYMDVLWYSSGATPSFSAASQRASGAFSRAGWVKSGW